MIYTGSVRRKIMAPYVQCGVDSMLRPALCHPLDLYQDLEVFCCVLYGVFLCRWCRSRDPCHPLYSPGEAGVLVVYKVEILVGLCVTSSSRITCRESYLD